MINLDDQAAIAEHIRKYLGRHEQLALGTVNADGSPWVVCVNMAYDDQFNIIWKSLKSTAHSQNIIQNPNVAICVFSEDKKDGDFGLYCTAQATEVTDEAELKRLLAIRYAGKKIPPTSDFLGNAPARIYVAKIEEAYFNDDRHLKTKVDLRVLRSKP